MSNATGYMKSVHNTGALKFGAVPAIGDEFSILIEPENKVKVLKFIKSMLIKCNEALLQVDRPLANGKRTVVKLEGYALDI